MADMTRKKRELLYQNATDSTDYQALIDRSVAAGDYRAAAQYEQKRNVKIDAMDALDLNPNGYTKSNLYSGYLERESVLDRSDRMDASRISDLYDQMAAAKEIAIDASVQAAVSQLEQAQEKAKLDFDAQRDQVHIDAAQARDRQVLYAAARGDRGGITARQYDSISNTEANNRRAIAAQQQALAAETNQKIADLRAQGEFKKAEAVLELAQQQLSQLWEMQQYDDSIRLQEEKLDMQQAGLTGIFNGNKTIDVLKNEQEQAENIRQQAQKWAREMAMESIQMGIVPDDSLLTEAGIERSYAAQLATIYKAQQSAKKSSSGSRSSTKTAADTTSLFNEMRTKGIEDYENAYAFLSGHSNNYSDKQVENNAVNYIKWLGKQAGTAVDLPADAALEKGKYTVDVDGDKVQSDVVRAYIELGMIRVFVDENGKTSYHWNDGVAQ